MIRRLIYSLKNLVQGNPKLYSAIYNLATSNQDYKAQRREIDQYSSKFGGMWTDRKDYPEKLAQKIEAGDLTDAERVQMQTWRDDGYVIIPGGVPHDLIDQYKADVAAMMDKDPSPLLMTSADLPEPARYTHDNLKRYGSARIVDDYFFSEQSRNLLFHDSITRFLELAFEADPVLTQTLRFDYGSQQALHQDTAFVRMNSPMKLIGVWVALEDITPGSGELIYLPGSHNWEGHLFSGRFKHYDADRDGTEDLDKWHQWILDEAEARGVAVQKFAAKKGDVLFWHAGLAHGGSEITVPGQTRLSLVAHFCPEGVRPLYHYYKPGQRKYYRHGKYRYTNSYYR